MLVNKALGSRQPNSVDNARVVQFIAKDKVILTAQSRNRADIRHVARIKRNGGFFALEFRDKFFQFLMGRLVACGKAGSPTPCAPLQNRLGHRLLEFVDVRQVQVRIGSQQNLFLRSATWHTDFYPRRFRRFHQAH